MLDPNQSTYFQAQGSPATAPWRYGLVTTTAENPLQALRQGTILKPTGMMPILAGQPTTVAHPTGTKIAENTFVNHILPMKIDPETGYPEKVAGADMVTVERILEGEYPMLNAAEVSDTDLTLTFGITPITQDHFSALEVFTAVVRETETIPLTPPEVRKVVVTHSGVTLLPERLYAPDWDPKEMSTFFGKPYATASEALTAFKHHFTHIPGNSSTMYRALSTALPGEARETWFKLTDQHPSIGKAVKQMATMYMVKKTVQESARDLHALTWDGKSSFTHFMAQWEILYYETHGNGVNPHMEKPEVKEAAKQQTILTNVTGDLRAQLDEAMWRDRARGRIWNSADMVRWSNVKEFAYRWIALA